MPPIQEFRVGPRPAPPRQLRGPGPSPDDRRACRPLLPQQRPAYQCHRPRAPLWPTRGGGGSGPTGAHWCVCRIPCRSVPPSVRRCVLPRVARMGQTVCPDGFRAPCGRCLSLAHTSAFTSPPPRRAPLSTGVGVSVLLPVRRSPGASSCVVTQVCKDPKCGPGASTGNLRVGRNCDSGSRKSTICRPGWLSPLAVRARWAWSASRTAREPRRPGCGRRRASCAASGLSPPDVDNTHVKERAPYRYGWGRLHSPMAELADAARRLAGVTDTVAGGQGTTVPHS